MHQTGRGLARTGTEPLRERVLVDRADNGLPYAIVGERSRGAQDEHLGTESERLRLRELVAEAVDLIQLVVVPADGVELAGAQPVAPGVERGNQRPADGLEQRHVRVP